MALRLAWHFNGEGHSVRRGLRNTCMGKYFAVSDGASWNVRAELRNSGAQVKLSIGESQLFQAWAAAPSRRARPRRVAFSESFTPRALGRSLMPLDSGLSLHAVTTPLLRMTDQLSRCLYIYIYDLLRAKVV